MRMRHLLISTTLLATGATLACVPDQESITPASDDPAASPASAVVPLAAPAAAGSAEPDLFVAGDGRVYMSWLEPLDADGIEAASTRRGRFALRFATLGGDSWSAPRTIAESDDFFVNWADFPSLVAAGDALVAHWLELNGGRGTSYDVHISRSVDGGMNWQASTVPHQDGTPTEHGFVSLVPEADGGVTAIWLDGRNLADRSRPLAEGTGSSAMTLRAKRFDSDGGQGPEALLDERICDCCQTSATYIGDSLVVVYRDRSPEEIRDIWTVRRTPDGWQPPTRLAHDDWQIPGCPVNGPAIAAAGDRGAVAWFSLRDGNPEVKVAFTGDAGASFSEPILLDHGSSLEIDDANPRQVANLAGSSSVAAPVPLGRVDVAWIDDAQVVVSWIVARGGNADVVLQAVGEEGVVGSRRTVATTGSGRASGFPRIVRQGNRLIAAWTQTNGPTPTVHTAAVALPLR